MLPLVILVTIGIHVQARTVTGITRCSIPLTNAGIFHASKLSSKIRPVIYSTASSPRKA